MLLARTALCARHFSAARRPAPAFDSATGILVSESISPIPKDLNFVDLVWQNCSKWESRVAMTCGLSGRSFTYGQTFGAFNTLGTNFSAELGLQQGDVVGIVLPNMPEFAITFFGATSVGLVVSPLNPLYTPDELAKLFTNCKMKAVVTSAPLLEKVQAALGQVPGGGGPVILVGDEKKEGTLALQDLTSKEKRGAQRLEKPPPEALAALPFSSGTTGHPKGVVITHRNLVANLCGLNHKNSIPSFEKGHDSTIALLPFFHIYGILAFLGLTLSRGNHLVTLPNFDPQTFTEALIKYKPSYMFMVPPLMSFIARSPSITKENLSSLKFLATGAAAVSSQILKEVAEKTKESNPIIKNGYGLTETSGMITITPGPVDFSHDAISIGKISANAEAKVVGSKGEALRLDEAGELWIRGPQIIPRYLNNQKATDETITEDGWLKTGDVAVIKQDGSIYLVDRLKEIIKVKGFQVSPTELEDTLIKMDGISDVAVAAVPHEDLGEVPRAFIVRKEGSKISEQDVRDFIESKVAKFKHLRGGVQFVPVIPKSAAGKILRKNLKDLIN